MSKIDNLEIISKAQDKYNRLVEPAWLEYMSIVESNFTKYMVNEISIEDYRANIENALELYEIVLDKGRDIWAQDVKGYEYGQ